MNKPLFFFVNKKSSFFFSFLVFFILKILSMAVCNLIEITISGFNVFFLTILLSILFGRFDGYVFDKKYEKYLYYFNLPKIDMDSTLLFMIKVAKTDRLKNWCIRLICFYFILLFYDMYIFFFFLVS